MNHQSLVLLTDMLPQGSASTLQSQKKPPSILNLEQLSPFQRLRSLLPKDKRQLTVMARKNKLQRKKKQTQQQKQKAEAEAEAADRDTPAAADLSQCLSQAAAFSLPSLPGKRRLTEHGNFGIFKKGNTDIPNNPDR
ncbi:hypothetical protein Ancab_019706 [Ancistrocladus abbreviatus]